MNSQSMQEMNKSTSQIVRNPTRSRMITGGIVFIAGQLAPLFIPLVITSGLPAVWKTTLSGFLMLGIPELAILLAVIILGKSGFEFFKQKIFAVFKRITPLDMVSKPRYNTGLVLFTIPLLAGWLLPYFTDLIPLYEENKLWINLSGDLMILISLFVLGGDFWDKIRGLFIYQAKIIIDK